MENHNVDDDFYLREAFIFFSERNQQILEILQYDFKVCLLLWLFTSFFFINICWFSFRKKDPGADGDHQDVPLRHQGLGRQSPRAIQAPEAAGQVDEDGERPRGGQGGWPHL